MPTAARFLIKKGHCLCDGMCGKFKLVKWYHGTAIYDSMRGIGSRYRAAKYSDWKCRAVQAALPFAGEVRPLLMVSVYSCCIEMEEGKIAQKALTLSTAQAKAE